jgi:hypothetical protein
MNEPARLSPAEALAAHDAGKAAPKAAPDPRFDRVPTVRQGWVLVIPSAESLKYPGRLAITETTTGGQVRLVEVGSGVAHKVELNVAELRALADHANRIARRVARRPERKP